MTGVSDLEAEGANGDDVKDTWLLRLPKEICDKEGFSEGTLVSLTIRDGGIRGSFIRPPSDELQKIRSGHLGNDRELHRRLKEIGD